MNVRRQVFRWHTGCSEHGEAVDWELVSRSKSLAVCEVTGTKSVDPSQVWDRPRRVSELETIVAIDGPPPFSGGAQIQVLDPDDVVSWDAKVSTSRHACFFHGAAWPRVLADAYGHSPAYFTITDRSGVAGLLPVIEVRSRFTGRRGVSVALADFCPPLFLVREQYLQLLHHALAFGRDRGWNYYEGRGGFDLVGELPSFRRFYGHSLDLRRSLPELFANLESRVRRAVRKAEGSGVKVEFPAGEEPLAEFYRLHCQTRRKHGVPPQPFHFFESLFEHALKRGQGTVGVARLNGLAVSAAVYLHFGSQVIYKYGASDERFHQLRPNNLLMWEAIRLFRDRGFAEVHFGRTSLANSGLRFYKLGFGVREESIDYFRFDYKQRRFQAGSEPPPSWVNRAFGLLPEPLARLAGRILYGHVS